MADIMLNELRHAIDAYKFTITSKDDPQLLHLKKLISQHNKAIRRYVRNHKQLLDSKLLRVSLMARGKRRDKYGARLHPNCDSNLQHKYASRFDVYIHECSTGNSELQAEIETGLTSSQQRKVKAIRWKRLKQEWADDAALREAGIYFHNVKGPYSYNDKDYMSRDEYIKLARQRHPNMPESTFERLFSAK